MEHLKIKRNIEVLHRSEEGEIGIVKENGGHTYITKYKSTIHAFKLISTFYSVSVPLSRLIVLDEEEVSALLDCFEKQGLLESWKKKQEGK